MVNNDEIRMMNDEGMTNHHMTKSECSIDLCRLKQSFVWSLVLDASFAIRHSDFVIPIPLVLT
jgi:hypothetical protein